MLKDKIQEDLKAAMLAKEEEKLSTIRMLKSAIQYFEIQKGADRSVSEGSSPASDSADRGGRAGYEASDEDIIDVVGKEVKKRREAIDLYEKGGRPELAAKEKREIEFLSVYLPEQMSETEISKLVDEAVSSTGAKTMQEMGKVMQILMPKVKGRAEAGTVSNLVMQKLGS